MAGSPPSCLGQLYQLREGIKSSRLLESSLRFVLGFACVHHTEDSLSAKANCSLITLLYVGGCKSKPAEVLLASGVLCARM